MKTKEKDPVEKAVDAIMFVLFPKKKDIKKGTEEKIRSMMSAKVLL